MKCFQPRLKLQEVKINENSAVISIQSICIFASKLVLEMSG